MRVLVVEDNPDAAQSMAMLLRQVGYDVRIALDGPTALKEAEESQPDVVFLDIGLPGLDCCEMAMWIRGQARDRQPLLIAITGYGREEDRERSAAAGIHLHLVKPADPRQLEAVLKKFEQIVLAES